LISAAVLGIFRAMIKLVVFFVGIVWASLVLISWGGA
jgi:hypothetical protein